MIINAVNNGAISRAKEVVKIFHNKTDHHSMTTIKKCFYAAMLLFMTVPAMAQQLSDGAKDQLNWLLSLEGRWQANDATMQAGNDVVKFTYISEFKKAASNNGITMHEWGTIPGMGNLEGQNLAGVDPYDGKIHWYTVDNVGDTHEHIGSFSDSKHFMMMHKSMRDGKEFIETIEMEFISANKLNLKIVATLGGAEQQIIKGTFIREMKN